MADGEPDAVARRLEEARQRRGLSLAELARRAQVSASTLSLISRGLREGGQLSLDVACRLCVALGISLDWLAGRWQQEMDPSLTAETEWLLQAPGGLQQVVEAVLTQVLDKLKAQSLPPSVPPEEEAHP